MPRSAEDLSGTGCYTTHELMLAAGLENPRNIYYLVTQSLVEKAESAVFGSGNYARWTAGSFRSVALGAAIGGYTNGIKNGVIIFNSMNKASGSLIAPDTWAKPVTKRMAEETYEDDIILVVEDGERAFRAFWRAVPESFSPGESGAFGDVLSLGLVNSLAPGPMFTPDNNLVMNLNKAVGYWWVNLSRKARKACWKVAKYRELNR